MPDRQWMHSLTVPAASLPAAEAEKTSTSVLSAAPKRRWSRRLWHTVKHYPLPCGAVTLMIVSLVLWLAGYDTLANWTLLVVVLLGGIPLLWETVQQFLHKEFGVDVIAILAIAGSIVLGQYLAGALEAYALRRARSSLSALSERAPRAAHIWQGDELISIPADQVEVGMEIVVKPGELISVDGVVISGSASISEADLTGEPVPVRKAPGMLVLSGSVNLDGVLEVRASKRSAESKFAQIVRLVEEAQTQKAPIHRLADRYSVWFTIAAVSLAGLSWALSGDSVYALAVMVCASPCPLILATPVAIMSGIDLAARNGIIAKSGGAIEQLREVDIAVFDKTGTLTLGMPRVTAIVPVEQEKPDAGVENKDESGGPRLLSGDEGTLLRLAASVEQLSTHILARAVVEAAQERSFPLSSADGFEEIFGKGVRGRVPLIAEDRREAWPSAGNNVEVAVGNRTFMQHLDIPIPASLIAEREQRVERGQICSFIAVEKRVEGLLVLEDVPRAELCRLSSDLRAAGIKETILLTGDSEVVAHQIGKIAQVDRVISRCLPEDKVRIVKEMYPRFIREAGGAGRADAAASFRLALEREKHHRVMFKDAAFKQEPPGQRPYSSPSAGEADATFQQQRTTDDESIASGILNPRSGSPACSGQGGSHVTTDGSNLCPDSPRGRFYPDQ
jgi:heavy metal translocating P-type ATPase